MRLKKTEKRHEGKLGREATPAPGTITNSSALLILLYFNFQSPRTRAKIAIRPTNFRDPGILIPKVHASTPSSKELSNKAVRMYYHTVQNRYDRVFLSQLC